ncbi:MAG: VWA-like domain-containing protein, partial [Arcobacteraceae bacterium]
MKVTLKLTKAKSQLSSKHPYFGMLASRLQHEENTQIEYFVSNGVKFIYNPNYIESLSIDELFFILSNCVMHHILAHKARKLKRKGALWQLATDYAINNMLVKNKLKLPKGANYNKEYKNMYSEEIYEILKKELTLENSITSFDDISSLKNFLNQKEGDSSIFKNFEKMDEKAEDEWDYAATLAQEIGNKNSTTPLGLERFAKKMQSNNIDWKFELYNAINRHMRNNYAFMPPNKKHIYRGVALPSLTSDTLSLVVAIDTSGSINEELLGGFVSEFKAIMQNFPSIAIELIIADAKVHSHHSFMGAEDFDIVL